MCTVLVTILILYCMYMDIVKLYVRNTPDERIYRLKKLFQGVVCYKMYIIGMLELLSIHITCHTCVWSIFLKFCTYDYIAKPIQSERIPVPQSFSTNYLWYIEYTICACTSHLWHATCCRKYQSAQVYKDTLVMDVYFHCYGNVKALYSYGCIHSLGWNTGLSYFLFGQVSVFLF